MARKPRIHIPGGVYHVMLRGNGDQDIFFNDDDRYHLYLLLQEGVSRFDYRIHGFCFMVNHIHLAIQVGEESLSRIMQNLSFRYTRWINHRQNRMGHLFQGRYKAILIDRDSYLLELVRYIHLNPVRAKLVRQPGAYPWSGHRCYLGKDTISWLHTDWVLSQLGKRINTCRKRYEEFVRAGRGEGYRPEFHGEGGDQRLLGGERFVRKMLGKAGGRTHKKVHLNVVVQCVCNEYNIKAKDLASTSRNRHASEARQVIGWLALKIGNITLTEVAQSFGRDVTTLSRGARRMDNNVKNSKLFEKKLHQLYIKIMQT
ncbi:MAG: transposase [Gammaproteobacteria bacterium]|nr:transposase [Gammaproteobacteria bacterium]